MARLEPAVTSGGLLKLYQALWAPYYQAALSVLGSAGTVLPFGDPHHGQPNATTFATKGEEQVTFTWSEAPNAFDTPLDLTGPASFQGIIPLVGFNETDEEADTPDADYWFVDDSAAAPLSLGAWVSFPAAGGIRTILSKWDSAGGAREWELIIAADETLAFYTADQSVSKFPSRRSNAALVTGAWHHVVAAYDGGGGATNHNGTALYVDGAAAASTAFNEGGYVAMENLAGLVSVGARPGTASNFYGGKIAGGPLGPFFTKKQLSADEVKTLYDLGRAALAL